MYGRIPTGRSLKIAVAALCIAVFAASCIRKYSEGDVVVTGTDTVGPVSKASTVASWGEFKHAVPEHNSFDCNSCHRNAGQKEIQFAGHESCVGCHLNQFTKPETAMCAICHTDLGSADPPVVPFPAEFDSEPFNMKFDHAAHTKGDALPKEGCAACHEPMGPGKSIPVGIKAHQNCMTCHTPESKIGSCSVCHETKPYQRTPQSRYVFKAVFSHADHGPRQKVDCADCHTVKEGASQSQQVTNIVAKQHNVPKANTCYACHDGNRAFSGNNPLQFENCRRCHRGSGFDMLPGQ